MGKLTNKKIEELAILAVKSAFINIPEVTTYLNENDKTYAIDGQIVYNKKCSEKKEDNRAIFVQIKGTSKKHKQNSNVKYSIKKSDLICYKQDTLGILFFFAFVNNNNPIIYYQSLLPYDINKLLSEMKETKSKRIILKKLPSNSKDICNLLEDFIINSDRQANISKLTLDSSIPITDGRINFDLRLSTNPYSHFSLKNDIYIYKDSGLFDVCIDKISKIINIFFQQNIYVQCGEYEENCVVEFDNNYNLSFNSFQFDTTNKTFKFKKKGNVFELHKKYLLLKNLVLGEPLLFNGQTITKIQRQTEKVIAKINQQYKFYYNVNKLASILNINPKWQIENLTNDEILYLYILVNGFVLQENVKLEDETSCVRGFEIQDTYIVFIAEQIENAEYKLIDYQSNKFRIANYDLSNGPNNQNEITIPSLFIFSDNDLKKIINIDNDRFINQFPRMKKNKFFIEICTQKEKQLRKIAKKSVCKDELIKCADWLLSYIKEPEQ